MTDQPDVIALAAAVIGTTSGIGKAAALRLAADGFLVLGRGGDAVIGG